MVRRDWINSFLQLCTHQIQHIIRYNFELYEILVTSSRSLEKAYTERWRTGVAVHLKLGMCPADTGNTQIYCH